MVEHARFNGVADAKGIPLGGNRVNPEPGIRIITIYMEYIVRQPVPVVEITKKPPIEFFPTDGFLHTV
jgi:hypothetical protein